MIKGRVSSLELFNFKSYAGVHVISNISEFMCVIGPNGSGKSNIMEAISFGLGATSKRLRGSNLLDLIYRSETETLEDIKAAERNATVTITLEFSEPATSTLTCSRRINHNGTSSYYINGKSVSYDNFSARLDACDILIKTSNFLVFQGDVEQVALRSPQELTHLLEEVSGSDKLAKSCAELDLEVNNNIESLSFLNNRRMHLENSKRLLTTHMTAYNRYKEMCGSRNKLKASIVAYNLLICDKKTEIAKQRLDSLVDDKEEADAHLKQVTKICMAGEAELRAMQQSVADKQMSLDETSTSLNGLREGVIESVTSIENINSELKASMKVWENAEKKSMTLDNRLEKAQSNLKKIQDECDQINEQLEECDKSVPAMTDEDLAEYESIVMNNQVLAASLTSKMDELKQRRDALTDLTMQLRRERDDLQAHQAKEQDTLEDLRTRVKAAENQEKQLDVEFQATEELLKTKMKELESGDKVRKEKQSKIEDLENRLKTCRASEHSIQEIRDRLNLVDNMKASVHGIYGLVSVLIEPVNAEYEVSMAPALGRFANYIICEDFTSANKGVQYLKAMRKAKMYFMGLQILRPQSAASNVQTVDSIRRISHQNNATLYQDCIKYDPRFQPVVDIAIGTTVLCRNLDEAHHLSYKVFRQKGFDVRIVTIDGQVILKNGNYRVGSVKSQRNQAQSIVQYKKELNILYRELDDLHSCNTLIEETNSLCQQIKRLECIRANAISSKSRNEASLQQSEKDICELKSKLDDYTEHIRANEAELSDISEKLASAISEMDDMFRSSFANMEARMGVENLYNLMTAHEEKKKSLTKNLNQALKSMKQAESDVTRVEKLIETHDTEMPILKKKIKKLESKMKKEEGQLLNRRQNLENLQIQIKVLKDDISVAEAECEKLKSKNEQELVDLKSARSTLNEIKASVQRVNNELTEIRLEKHRHIKSCVAEEPPIEIKFLDDVKFADIIHKMNYSTQVEDGTEIRVDFEKHLTESMIDNCDIQNHDDELRGFHSELSKLTVQIEKGKSAATNVSDQLKAIRADLNDVDAEIRAMKKTADDTKNKYYLVKRERKALFMDAFRYVQQQVLSIYAMLTAAVDSSVSTSTFLGDVTTISGKAYFELEDGVSEPYNSGIIYTVMPPQKRFRDMNQLSGGEKSMAALALLFAIQSVRPAPFIVLDEVDAALDSVNVDSLSEYLVQLNYQRIVISLKDRLYCRSKSLLGVYKNFQGTSNVLTYDLSRHHNQYSMSGSISGMSLPSSSKSSFDFMARHNGADENAAPKLKGSFVE